MPIVIINLAVLISQLYQQSMTISTEGKIIATAGRLALVNSTHNITHVPTRKTRGYLLLPAADVAADGLERVMIRTVDTDVLILSV